MSAVPWGVLPQPLYASNTSPWVESIAFVDASGAAVAIATPMQIALRKGSDKTGFNFLFAATEITITSNVATWSISADRMATIDAGKYDIEITNDAALNRRVRVRGEVVIVAGIVP